MKAEPASQPALQDEGGREPAKFLPNLRRHKWLFSRGAIIFIDCRLDLVFVWLHATTIKVAHP